MPCPSHSRWLDNSDYTWRRVQVMKLLIMQLSPTSRHFISLPSKYSIFYVFRQQTWRKKFSWKKWGREHLILFTAISTLSQR
jgi:hypothetical protein